MKLTAYDKYHALIHSEKYRKDYKHYELSRGAENDYAFGGKLSFGAKLSEAGKMLCRKWSILYPINPNKKNADEKALGLLKFMVQPSITYLDSPENWREWESIAWNISDHKSDTEDLNELAVSHVNGKLVLMVDTTRTKSELMQDFEIFIDYWSTAQRKKPRPTKADKWKVFEERTYRGKTLLKIAREIYQFEGDVAYDDNANKYYQRIYKAYQKALEMIEFIESEAESKSFN